jgi:molybdopterin molybdotransferase
MVTVAEAENIIQAQTKHFGTEQVPFDLAPGRVLAEDIKADRDLPPCNRVTMDGIAISYAAFENGTRHFKIKGTQAAGGKPLGIDNTDDCIEIMTGGALPNSADTVIRYEDLEIEDGVAKLLIDKIRKGQNIHQRGKDKKQGDVVAITNQVIDPTSISMAASVGKSLLIVKKLPSVVIISTGDELVNVNETPAPYQVRHSNNHTIKATLQPYGIQADLLHIPDEPAAAKEKIKHCLAQYDVIILSGGISMGKFDYVPQVLEELDVKKLFHKVQQRPGKPFWFGRHENGALVFAFPGNPVSTFMCLHRYFLPWLEASLQINRTTPNHAVLNADVMFAPTLQYFVQVKVTISEQGQFLATPMEGNGSGDFANLLDTNAFMELPMEQTTFRKGEVYRIWPFKKII